MSFTNVGNYNAGVIGGKSTASGPMNGVPVMDEAGIASGGAFLTSELEKRDTLIRKPLTSFTYPRDIVIQTGGGWVDYVSALAVASFPLPAGRRFFLPRFAPVPEKSPGAALTARLRCSKRVC